MNEDIVDLQEVMERVQNDIELLIELFDIFEEDYRQKREEISKAIQQANYDELRNIAHSLKGASSNISAKGIFRYFAQLEKAAEQRDPAHLDGLLKTIDQEYKKLQAFIAEYKKKFGKI